ncbi:MAG TPA: nitroreductase family protein [Pseudonocardiaceae bacterium]
MTEVASKIAVSSAELHPLIAQRWSPRALDPTAELTDDQLRALLEAARWAPSFGNTQPARYLVGRRGDETFGRVFEALTDRNKDWARNAAALLLGVVVTRGDKGEIPYTDYGLALATENLVLQAVAEELVAHQMAGFDHEAASRAFELPEDVQPRIVVAVGRSGDPERLPERMRDRELAPRNRLPLAELAFAGRWGRPAF